MTHLILASSSPARKRLLDAAGVAFHCQPAQIDEAKLRSNLQGAPPADIAEALAEAKALQISQCVPDALVLGADQILALPDGRILSKADNREEAGAQLRLLRDCGRHDLISAQVCAEAGRSVWRYVSTAQLVMRPFSDEFLDDYLNQCMDTVLGSVGCYHIEGLGAQLFSRIEGDIFTIQGLSLIAVLDYLRDRNLIAT